MQLNPVRQIYAWGLNLLDAVFVHWATVSAALAGVLALYLGWIIVDRVQDGDTPSFSYESGSEAGTTSFEISGVHLSMSVAGAIALLLWPLPVQDVRVAFGLAGLVMAHFVLAKEEVGEA